MTHLVFFEKPGCGGNARQRAALMAAGHTLEQRNDDGTRHVGFDTADIHEWIGLGTKPASTPSLEGCASPTERCAAPT